MNKIKIPSVLIKMNEIFQSHGYEAYLVGGAVRDTLMGKTPHDLDLTTNARPEEVMSIFHKVIPTGISHGTVTVHFLNNEIEVTTFRTEGKYTDGRHPDTITYANTIEEDLSRRDFTMNAIAISLKDGSIVDPFKGQEDIKNKIIRTVGNPYERFSEDGLRPVRAIRFMSKLHFNIEEETYNAIKDPSILKISSKISIERFRDEFIKILESEEPSIGLKALEETGILKIFMPVMLEGRGCIQGDDRGFHDFDVLDHLFYACNGSPCHKLNVRLAALLHDIGKPESKRVITENGLEHYTFYNHEVLSSKISRKLLTDLKFPNALIDNVCHLIVNHMFYYESVWTDSAVRRFLMRVGKDNLEDLFDLRVADVYGMHRQKLRFHDTEEGHKLLEFKERIEKVLQEDSCLSLKDLKVNGKDLMDIGIPKGKIIGTILNQLLETVLDDPKENEREKLLLIAKNIYNSSILES